MPCWAAFSGLPADSARSNHFKFGEKCGLAQLEEALLRDARYIVGIKLHTAGWTVEQGAKFFDEKAFQEPANAYGEARRGAYNPTYLYYTLGKLQIYKLREDYRKARDQAIPFKAFTTNLYAREASRSS